MSFNHVHRSFQFFLFFLVYYSLVTAIFLFVPIIPSKGWKLTLIVGIFFISIIFFIKVFQLKEWIPFLIYSTMASLFQIFPDWFLAEALGVLVFPEESFFLIGKVPFYMAGMWAIPFFILLVSSRMLKEIFPKNPIPLHILAGLIGLVIFWISEETLHLIPVWYPQQVRLISNSAIYVLPAEFFLGVYISWSYQISTHWSWFHRFIIAMSVFVFYTGALGVSYLFIEKIV